MVVVALERLAHKDPPFPVLGNCNSHQEVYSQRYLYRVLPLLFLTIDKVQLWMHVHYFLNFRQMI